MVIAVFPVQRPGAVTCRVARARDAADALLRAEALAPRRGAGVVTPAQPADEYREGVRVEVKQGETRSRIAMAGMQLVRLILTDNGPISREEDVIRRAEVSTCRSSMQTVSRACRLVGIEDDMPQAAENRSRHDLLTSLRLAGSALLATLADAIGFRR